MILLKIELALIRVPVDGYARFSELRMTESLDILKESIKNLGMLEPVRVKKIHGNPPYSYELILYRYRLWNQNSSHAVALPVVPESFCVETGFY